ncbi:MAG TPA: hypothetical protein DCQ33_13940 [Nitrospira sp.]|nr:hypothetical protein [Nitrospira sp.]
MVHDIYFKVTLGDDNWQSITVKTAELKNMKDLLEALRKHGGYEYVSLDARGGYSRIEDIVRSK